MEQNRRPCVAATAGSVRMIVRSDKKRAGRAISHKDNLNVAILIPCSFVMCLAKGIIPKKKHFM